MGLTPRIKEPHDWISAAPGWVFEVLSPGTAGKDKVRKTPIYAQHGVPHFWLADPGKKTLEVFGLESGRWVVAGFFGEKDRVWIAPFEEAEIDLRTLRLSRESLVARSDPPAAPARFRRSR